MPSLSIGEHSFHYLLEGEGRPVLLLHGHGSRAADWDLQIPALAASYRVIGLDQRGHGESARAGEGCSIEQLASDAAAVLRRLVVEPAHVIGHSLGGAVALQLALDAPALVRSLTIINSQAGFREGSWFVRMVLGGSRLIPRLFGFRFHARMIAAGYLPGPHLAERRARFLESWARNDLESYLAVGEAVGRFDVTERLGEIGVPVLVVASDHDVLPLARKQELCAKLRDARLVTIERSHHVPLWDQPEDLNRELLVFLRSVDAAAPG